MIVSIHGRNFRIQRFHRKTPTLIQKWIDELFEVFENFRETCIEVDNL